MAFLASKGYDTYSISLRGTSGTPIPAVEVTHSLYHTQRQVRWASDPILLWFVSWRVDTVP